jgi:hypothetical protein
MRPVLGRVLSDIFSNTVATQFRRIRIGGQCLGGTSQTGSVNLTQIHQVFFVKESSLQDEEPQIGEGGLVSVVLPAANSFS